MVRILRIEANDRESVSLPIQAYAFQASPSRDHALDDARIDQTKYFTDHVTLVAEAQGEPVADASAIPMRQNVRGVIYPMAGIAGVATLPHARRRGYATSLLTELLGMMRDSGHAVSALYPFRQSFYARFGFVGLPKSKSVTFPVSNLARLLTADLPGEVHWGLPAKHYAEYEALAAELLSSRHGFALLPESRMARLRDAEDRWLAIARANGTVVGAATYRITGYGGDLIADDLLISGPLGRALLLRFFALHAEQVTRVRVMVPAGELPELWATDFASETIVTTSFPTAPAPMARVLSLTDMTGMRVGTGHVDIEVTDDPYIAGTYSLDGTAGMLEVRRTSRPSVDATLTAAGLSGLVYGVLDPGELAMRGLGRLADDIVEPLRQLFPACIPYLHAAF